MLTLGFHKKLNNLFLLSAWFERLFSAPKITTFLPKSKPEIKKILIENIYFQHWTTFLVRFTAPNKKASNLKVVFKSRDHISKSKTIDHFWETFRFLP